MKQLFILDGANYLFRSYFAIRGMSNEKGVATNALFGFIRSLLKLRKDFSPTHLICVFDGPDNKASRKVLYAEYKSHRERMPEDLFPQLDLAKEYCIRAGIPHLEINGVEADDTIGTIAKWAEKKGAHVYLCSSDKDLCQLVSDKVQVLQTYKDNLVLDKEKVEEVFGVRPDQMVDYLAMVGDTSDNIPGIQGFGPKTAAELLKQFGTLEALLRHPEEVASKSRREKILAEKENALLSQKLATINTHLTIPHEEEFYHLKPPNLERLRSFFEEMNFKSLLKELESEAPSPPVQLGKRFVLETKEEVRRCLQELTSAKEIVIDVETTSPHPMLAELVGVGIASSPSLSYYIPLNASLPQSFILDALFDFVQNTRASFIGHNIKYDMHVLKRYGIALPKIGFDTMIASYVLHAHINRHNLDLLSLEMLGIKKTPIEDLIGKKGDVSMRDLPIPLVANYCLEDVECTLKLKELFAKELRERHLETLFETIEIPLIPVLARMEERGIFVDVDYLHTLSKEFGEKISHLQEEIFTLADAEFNLNSPKQLSEILFEKLTLRKVGKKTASGYSTSAEVLETLINDHPIVEKILTYRTLEKLRSTYIDALPLEVNPRTKRIHCSFNQSVTATGRLSSTNPNLQNIPIRSPEGKRIREAFIPEKAGFSFLSADYSQIELRLLAHLSGDEHLIRAFHHGADIHLSTASHIFGVPLAEVTKEMRSKAKAVNFGIIYGQQAFGLSKQLGIDVKEAGRFIDTYFKKYPQVKEYLDHSIHEAEKSGKTKTLFGRERLLPEIHSTNAILKAQSKRLAVNAPIQGTQADIIKKAMIEIDQALLKGAFKSAMILQIHDELIFEVPQAEMEEVKKIVVSKMEGVITLKVPLKVDISVGKNWGEC